jgi:hypothetical protein
VLPCAKGESDAAAVESVLLAAPFQQGGSWALVTVPWPDDGPNAAAVARPGMRSRLRLRVKVCRLQAIVVAHAFRRHRRRGLLSRGSQVRILLGAPHESPASA